MTEADWQTCKNPWVLLPALGPLATDRKLRLFVCACLHRRLDHSPFDGFLESLQELENALDQPRSKQPPPVKPAHFELELGANLSNIAEAMAILERLEPMVPAQAALAADLLVDSFAVNFRHFDQDQERAAQCRLLRDIFANPCRPVSIDPVWRSATVTALAQGIYDDGAFESLPILADALEDAGCTSVDVLSHCREPGIHVKGCWLIDLLLQRK